jgi:hypothetical protein
VLGDHDGDGAGIEGFEDVRDIAGVGDVVAGMQFEGVANCRPKCVIICCFMIR